jgi:dCTP diphosphatase
MSEIKQLQQMIRKFRDERDWMQFHNPKNLACSISIEAAELLEHFQWKTPEESEALGKDQKEKISHEIADVAVYLLELADNLDIDLSQAIQAKLALNAAKYPIIKAKGSAVKYTEL